MGTIRPKVGAKVKLRSWLHVNGNINGKEAPPNDQWTGEVVGVTGDTWKYYHVKRDYDGEVVTAAGSDLKYVKEERTKDL